MVLLFCKSEEPKVLFYCCFYFSWISNFLVLYIFPNNLKKCLYLKSINPCLVYVANILSSHCSFNLNCLSPFKVFYLFVCFIISWYFNFPLKLFVFIFLTQLFFTPRFYTFITYFLILPFHWYDWNFFLIFVYVHIIGATFIFLQ